MSNFIQEMTETLGFNNKKTLWQMYIDGASRKPGLGVEIILIGPGKLKIEYTVRIAYGATHNVTEYEALITGLKLANKV